LSFYLSNDGETGGAHLAWVTDPSGILAHSVSSNKVAFLATDPMFRDTGQVGSLAGAAYLLNNNAGVLSDSQWRQKRHVAHKGKWIIDFDFQY